MTIQTEGWVHIRPTTQIHCLPIVYLDSILTVPPNGWSLFRVMFMVKLIKRCEFSMKLMTIRGTWSDGSSFSMDLQLIPIVVLWYIVLTKAELSKYSRFTYQSTEVCNEGLWIWNSWASKHSSCDKYSKYCILNV